MKGGFIQGWFKGTVVGLILLIYFALFQIGTLTVENRAIKNQIFELERKQDQLLERVNRAERLLVDWAQYVPESEKAGG